MKRPYAPPTITATFKRDDGWYCERCSIARFDLVLPDESAIRRHIAEHGKKVAPRC